MMKKPRTTRLCSGIEILESRIAPAAVTLSFFDQDGKAVSITSSKGTLAQLQTAVGVAPAATAAGVINLALGVAGNVFKGADLTITAGASTSDGVLTRVEFINAAGLDLGKVTIDGELDRINVGDTNSATTAINTITVDSWGNGEAYDSVVVGGINSLTVKNDFNGAYLKVGGSDSDNATPPAHTTDGQGRIGALFIGGSLLGSARENGGHIWATGDIPTVTVAGSVRGFTDVTPPSQPPTGQDFSGRIFSGGVINTLLIGTDGGNGGVIGGGGAFSGQIASAAGIRTVTIKGTIQGGIGLESGAIGAAGDIGMVTVTGAIIGGGGDRSGALLSSSSIKSVNLGGDLIGGPGFNSGAIGSILGIGTVAISGDIVGGDGVSSGQVVSHGMIKSVTVENVIGGSKFESGGIGSLKALGTILVKGSLYAGTGARSGIIATEQESSVRDFSETPLPPANAPIGSVTILGSIHGDLFPADAYEPGGYRAGSILSSGQLGPVVVQGDVIGSDGYESGAIVSNRGITSVKIGGMVGGGYGGQSGAIIARGSLGPVSIGDPNFYGEGESGSFAGHGIEGGSGFRSGAVIAGQISKIDVYGDLAGGFGDRSGVIETTDYGVAGKIGPVYIRGSVIGGGVTSEIRHDIVATGGLGTGVAEAYSGAILSSGAITSVLIGADVIGGSGEGSGSIMSKLDMGSVKIGGSIEGGYGDYSGSIISQAKITSVSVGQSLRGGDGAASGFIGSGGNMGNITIGAGAKSGAGDIVGGYGARSGSVESSSKLAKIDVFGAVLGGNGAFSGSIRTVHTESAPGGDMGPVFIARSLVGDLLSSPGAMDSASIISSGKIASVIIGDPRDSDVESGSGSGNVIGGAADRSGSIRSESDMGPVRIAGSVCGGIGGDTGRIQSGGKLANVSIGIGAAGGSLLVGYGDRSGSILAGGNLAAVTIADLLQGGVGTGSGFVASGATLGSFQARWVSGGGDFSRPRISATDKITAVTIEDSVFNADILAGYGTGGLTEEQNPDAQIGTVKIGALSSVGEVEIGRMEGTNIVAGLGAGSDGMFGTADDHLILGADNASIFSRIASVIITGSVYDTGNSGDRFGIVAQNLAALKIGGVAIPLQSGALNDAYALVTSASDMVYGEKPSTVSGG